jgi:dolichyl-phosphate-mannose-protein mannosyltransferase
MTASVSTVSRPAGAALTGWWAVAMGAIWVAGVAIRLPALAHDLRVTNDVETLRGWMHLIGERGLLLAYTHTTVDYPPVPIYWLALAARLEPLLGQAWPTLDVATLLVKLPALAADLATAAIIGWAVSRQDARWGVVAVAAYLFNPAVWYVSSLWGQTDAVYTLWLVLAVVALQRRAAPMLVWLAFALALSTKPQALCLAPLLVMATVRQHGWRALAAGLSAWSAALAVLWAPWLLAGQWAVLRSSPLAHLPGSQLSITAFNFWYLLRWGAVSGFSAAQSVMGWPVSYQTLARVGYLAVAGGLLVLAWRRPLRVALMGAVLALAFFLFMPDMRERYLFPLPALFMLMLADSAQPFDAHWKFWAIYTGLSLAWLFNLVMIASAAPGLWVNLVVPQPETPGLPALRVGALLAAGLMLASFVWLARRLAWRGAHL